MLPQSSHRVPEHTMEKFNEQIRRETDQHVADFASLRHTPVDMRLEELKDEWDVERTLQANAAFFSMLGLALGGVVDKRFYLFSGMVAGFFLQHALQGWCPPLPVLRRLGVRTAREIEEERQALKVMRGDYVGHARAQKPQELLRAATG